MVLSREMRAEKLRSLAKSEGVSVEELAKGAVMDSVCAGICIEPGCDYTTETEPDQRAGYCEACGKNTVQSCLVLLALI